MPNWFSATASGVSTSATQLRRSVAQTIRRFLARDQALSFQQVSAFERQEVDASRRLRLRNQQEVANDLVGVAFSGGGIRSATFNLGILQGLAKKGYLSQIDYLSTVSGGGHWSVAHCLDSTRWFRARTAEIEREQAAASASRT